MNYTLIAAIAIFGSIMYGAPKIYSHFSGLPEGVRHSQNIYDTSELPRGMTKMSEDKLEMPSGLVAFK